MPTAVRSAILTASPRKRFIAGVNAIVGLANVRFLWIPTLTDAAVSYTSEQVGPRTLTWDASVNGRLSRLGNGYLQSFDGSTQYGSVPDTADMTFGNAATDTAFSVVVLANVTDTAAQRDLVGKWISATNQAEYILVVTATDLLELLLADGTTINTFPFRASNAAIAMGSPHLFGASYDATGGATAANGITLYQDGAVIASTATNNAGYIAMGNHTSAPEIGTQDGHASSFFQGSMGAVIVCQANLTAAQHLSLKALFNQFYGLSL